MYKRILTIQRTVQKCFVRILLASSLNISLSMLAVEQTSSNLIQNFVQAKAEMNEFQLAELTFDADWYIEWGEKLIEENKFEDSIYSFNEAINIDPKKYKAFYLRGLAYSQSGREPNYEKAIEDYSQAIVLLPNYLDAYFQRGRAYFITDKHLLALTDFDFVQQQDPEYTGLKAHRQLVLDDLKKTKKNMEFSAKQYFESGLNLSKKGDYSEAIDAFTHAIELAPKYADAYTQRGYAYSQLKKLQEAVKDYTTAINLNSQLAEAYFYRADAYENLSRFNDAIYDLTQAIQLQPKFTKAYYLRGYILSNRLKNHKKAIDDYTQAINQDSKQDDFWNSRGISYFHTEQYHKAIYDYNQALKINPNNEYAPKNLRLASNALLATQPGHRLSKDQIKQLKSLKIKIVVPGYVPKGFLPIKLEFDKSIKPGCLKSELCPDYHIYYQGPSNQEFIVRGGGWGYGGPVQGEEFQVRTNLGNVLFEGPPEGSPSDFWISTMCGLRLSNVCYDFYSHGNKIPRSEALKILKNLKLL